MNECCIFPLHAAEKCCLSTNMRCCPLVGAYCNYTSFVECKKAAYWLIRYLYWLLKMHLCVSKAQTRQINNCLGVAFPPPGPLVGDAPDPIKDNHDCCHGFGISFHPLPPPIRPKKQKAWAPIRGTLFSHFPIWQPCSHWLASLFVLPVSDRGQAKIIPWPSMASGGRGAHACESLRGKIRWLHTTRRPSTLKRRVLTGPNGLHTLKRFVWTGPCVSVIKTRGGCEKLRLRF